MPTRPMLEYLWIVPLLPLLGSAINGLLGAKWPNKTVTGWRWVDGTVVRLRARGGAGIF